MPNTLALFDGDVFPPLLIDRLSNVPIGRDAWYPESHRFRQSGSRTGSVASMLGGVRPWPI